MENNHVKLELIGIGELAKFLTHQEQGMKSTFRWERFPQAGMCRWQTSYDHSVDMTWLAIFAINKLSPFYPNLDKYLLLLGAFLHDFGEVILDDKSPGDVSFIEKEKNNNHRVGELDVFCRLFNSFDNKEQIKADLLPYYLMQYSIDPGERERLLDSVGLTEWKDLLFFGKEFEAKVFDAIEKLGYVIFTYQEYLKNPLLSLSLLILILKKHSNTLLRYSQEIKGFSFFYSLEDHQSILKFLENNKDVPDAFVQADSFLAEIARKKDFMNNEV